MEAPQYPAGSYDADSSYSAVRRDEHITEIAAAPLRVRQIAHHLADSHLNAYVRFKLALTEDRPTIKPYQEGAWADLPDGRGAEVEATLPLMEGLHARWVTLLRAMTPEQYARTYLHPEGNAVVPLFEALGYYAWHGRHHTAQILWVRRERLGLSD